jgi:putative membrane protein
MTRSILIAGVAIAAFSLAACGKHTQTAADNSIVPAPAATNAPAPTADDFVTKAASTDMFEIAEAKLALKRSTNADVKAFASMMLTDHTKSTAALKAAISSSGQNLVLPAAPPDDMRAKIDALSKSSDADFDKTYIGQQVDAHQAALGVMQGYGRDGDVPALKQFAAETSTVVQAHLGKAAALQGSVK